MANDAKQNKMNNLKDVRKHLNRLLEEDLDPKLAGILYRLNLMVDEVFAIDDSLSEHVLVQMANILTDITSQASYRQYSRLLQFPYASKRDIANQRSELESLINYKLRRNIVLDSYSSSASFTYETVASLFDALIREHPSFNTFDQKYTFFDKYGKGRGYSYHLYWRFINPAIPRVNTLCLDSRINKLAEKQRLEDLTLDQLAKVKDYNNRRLRSECRKSIIQNNPILLAFIVDDTYQNHQQLVLPAYKWIDDQDIWDEFIFELSHCPNTFVDFLKEVGRQQKQDNSGIRFTNFEDVFNKSLLDKDGKLVKLDVQSKLTWCDHLERLLTELNEQSASDSNMKLDNFVKFIREKLNLVSVSIRWDDRIPHDLKVEYTGQAVNATLTQPNQNQQHPNQAAQNDTSQVNDIAYDAQQSLKSLLLSPSQYNITVDNAVGILKSIEKYLSVVVLQNLPQQESNSSVQENIKKQGVANRRGKYVNTPHLASVFPVKQKRPQIYLAVALDKAKASIKQGRFNIKAETVEQYINIITDNRMGLTARQQKACLQQIFSHNSPYLKALEQDTDKMIKVIDTIASNQVCSQTTKTYCLDKLLLDGYFKQNPRLTSLLNNEDTIDRFLQQFQIDDNNQSSSNLLTRYWNKNTRLSKRINKQPGVLKAISHGKLQRNTSVFNGADPTITNAIQRAQAVNQLIKSNDASQVSSETIYQVFDELCRVKANQLQNMSSTAYQRANSEIDKQIKQLFTKRNYIYTNTESVDKLIEGQGQNAFELIKSFVTYLEPQFAKQFLDMFLTNGYKQKRLDQLTNHNPQQIRDLCENHLDRAYFENNQPLQETYIEALLKDDTLDDAAFFEKLEKALSQVNRDDLALKLSQRLNCYYKHQGWKTDVPVKQFFRVNQAQLQMLGIHRMYDESNKSLNFADIEQATNQLLYDLNQNKDWDLKKNFIKEAFLTNIRFREYVLARGCQYDGNLLLGGESDTQGLISDIVSKYTLLNAELTQVSTVIEREQPRRDEILSQYLNALQFVRTLANSSETMFEFDLLKQTYNRVLEHFQGQNDYNAQFVIELSRLQNANSKQFVSNLDRVWEQTDLSVELLSDVANYLCIENDTSSVCYEAYQPKFNELMNKFKDKTDYETKKWSLIVQKNLKWLTDYFFRSFKQGKQQNKLFEQANNMINTFNTCYQYESFQVITDDCMAKFLDHMENNSLWQALDPQQRQKLINQLPEHKQSEAQQSLERALNPVNQANVSEANTQSEEAQLIQNLRRQVTNLPRHINGDQQQYKVKKGELLQHVREMSRAIQGEQPSDDNPDVRFTPEKVQEAMKTLDELQTYLEANNQVCQYLREGLESLQSNLRDPQPRVETQPGQDDQFKNRPRARAWSEINGIWDSSTDQIEQEIEQGRRNTPIQCS